MSTPRDDRASAREDRRNLRIPTVGLGRAELIRSRSPSPAARAAGAFIFPPPRQQPEEDQFDEALANTPENNMPDLSVDDIVKIATASAQAAARELVAAAPPAAAEG